MTEDEHLKVVLALEQEYRKIVYKYISDQFFARVVEENETWHKACHNMMVHEMKPDVIECEDVFNKD